MKYLNLLFILCIVAFGTLTTHASNIEKPLPQKELIRSDKIAKALKEALSVGVDSVVGRVSKLNGFYKDKIIKILLPDEASSVIDKLNKTRTGRRIYKKTLSPIVNDLVESMNHSAEDAAKKAGPIFLSAIKQITIKDALKLLNSADTAATFYLKDKTYDSLTVTFKPDIENSLDKPLMAGQTTSQLWTKFVTAYNGVAKSPFNGFLSLDPIDEYDLSTYVTHKALDGVFYKVGEEEKKIRDKPAAQVTNLLKDVFGGLGKKKK